MARPIPTPDPSKISMHLDCIWEDRGDEDVIYCGHEVVGTCALCGEGITDGCGRYGCDGSGHADSKGGWVSTEHGHRTWCSQACRDRDPEDPER